MEVIRDWKQLKTVVDPNYTYCCVGFTKGPHLFNFTHEHLYNYSINRAQRMIGIVWNNHYDGDVFTGNKPTPPIYDDDEVIRWFGQKKFDYVFIPDTSFIHEVIEDNIFKEVRKEVDLIWKKEKYSEFLGNWSPDSNSSWIKLVFSRHQFLFSDVSGGKFINRTYQAVAPDGTWGFLYRHFWEKHCGGTYEMVPILRNDNGLAYDYIMEKYPKHVVDFFVELSKKISTFRFNRDIDTLKKDINTLFSNTLMPDTNLPMFNLESLFYSCNEITLNKYVFMIVITRNDDLPTYRYRMWEYDYDI